MNEPLPPADRGTLAGLYGGYALYFNDGASAVDLRHLRVTHLYRGVGVSLNPSLRLRHAQIVNCHDAVYVNSVGTVDLENVLIANVGSSGGNTQIEVYLASVAVDLYVPDDKRRVFDSAQPGLLVETPMAQVDPYCSTTVHNYVAGRIRFTMDAVGDSQLNWAIAGGVAGRVPNMAWYENTATFSGLPTDNGGFGKKKVRMYVDGLWGADGQYEVKVFYPARSLNHPGPTPSQGTRPPNYFYYLGYAVDSCGFSRLAASDRALSCASSTGPRSIAWVMSR